VPARCQDGISYASIPARNGCTCRFWNFPAGGFGARIWNCRRGLRLPSAPVTPPDWSPAASERTTTAVETNQPSGLPGRGEHLPGGWAALRGEPVRILRLSRMHCAHQCSEKGIRRGLCFNARRTRFCRRQRVIPRAACGRGGVDFRSADGGGMASATVTTMREWDKGRLPMSFSRAQCFVWPPEAFRNKGHRRKPMP